jgi:hypothetical protein
MKTKFYASIVVFFLLVTFPLVSTQTSSNIPRLGFLASSNDSVFATRLEALLRALRDLGYVEGRNIVIELPVGRRENRASTGSSDRPGG